MLRNWSGMITFLALAHMLDATQLVGDDHISCTCICTCQNIADHYATFGMSEIQQFLTSLRTFKENVPLRRYILQGMKTCQIQLVSDFVKTPKVLVSPRRNANFSTSACKSRVKQ